MKRVLEGRKESCDETEVVRLLSPDPLEARQGSHCLQFWRPWHSVLAGRPNSPVENAPCLFPPCSCIAGVNHPSFQSELLLSQYQHFTNSFYLSEAKQSWQARLRVETSAAHYTTLALCQVVPVRQRCNEKSQTSLCSNFQAREQTTLV